MPTSSPQNVASRIGGLRAPALALVFVALALGLLAACGSSGGTVDDFVAGGSSESVNETITDDESRSQPEPTATETPMETPTPQPEPTVETVATDETATALNTPAAETLEWVVALLNDPSPNPDEVASRFDERFLAQVPIEQIIGLIPEINLDATGPWSITEQDSGEFTSEAMINAPGAAALIVTLQVGANEPHKIEELLLVPASAAPNGDASTADATTEAEAVERVVETPATAALDWVVALLNDPAPSAEDINNNFDDRFLAEFPAEQILGLIPQLNLDATGPWSITTESGSELAIDATISAPGSTGLNVSLQVDEAEPHKIASLLFAPAFDAPTITTVDEYTAALADIAAEARVAIFEITNGECSTVLDLGADEVMPIGSIFKLWILAELAHQVESGEAAWDEILPVQDQYKASPDGTIFNTDEGSEVTLLTYAEEMISISDNSATDHLLHRLGRDRVEAAMEASGVADPARNVPFLSAAELFVIKFHPEGPNSDDYRALDTAGRRALLEEIEASVVPWIDGPESFPLTNADGVALSQPRDHDLEWFATPADLCRTHAYLAELATRPGLEPVADILNLNADAGIDFDPEVWTDLRFKGGSEQGIVAVAWRLARADGRVFVLAGGVEDETAPVSPIAAVATLQQGINLIEATS